MFDILQLNDMLLQELREVAEKLDIKGYKKLPKQELIYKILDEQALSKQKEPLLENTIDRSLKKHSDKLELQPRQLHS